MIICSTALAVLHVDEDLVVGILLLFLLKT